jgi:hypothetical protein
MQTDDKANYAYNTIRNMDLKIKKLYCSKVKQICTNVNPTLNECSLMSGKVDMLIMVRPFASQ